MAEKDIVVKEKLEFSGVFDFEAFYAYAFEWLRDHQWGVVEDKYAEKLSGTTRDITVEWRAFRKLTDYFNGEMSMKCEIKGMSDVEVEFEGKKKKANKGLVRLEFKGVLIRDPGSQWETTHMYKFFKDVYHKYIIPGRTDQMEDEIMEVVVGLKEALKNFFEILGKR